MSLMDILKWPDPRLSRVCDPVETIDDDMRELIVDMFETMYAAPGRGLAAPQVGRMIRVFVMDAGWKEGAPTPLALINPEIVWRASEIAVGEEGCLSIPGITADVPRPVAVRLRWTTQDGGTEEQDFVGAAALIAQHEQDHLDGIVTFDRVTPEERTALEADYAG